MRRFIQVFAGAVLAVTAASSFAEIEKFSIPNQKGMSFYWWPKLSPAAGWKQDRESSFRHGINAIAPDGKSFGAAETVMYARAVFKPRVPEVKSLAELVENDKKAYLANVAGVTVRDAPSISTADGRKLVSLIYTPREKGNWERVSYLDEGEFYLVFAITSRTEAGFNASAKAYEDMVSQYREKP
jgi:hypothetical protein